MNGGEVESMKEFEKFRDRMKEYKCMWHEARVRNTGGGGTKKNRLMKNGCREEIKIHVTGIKQREL